MTKDFTTGGKLRELMEGADSFKSYDDLKTAKTDPDAYVIMEGDWGGQIYLTCPAKYIVCDEDVLKEILKKLDQTSWECNGGDGAGIRFETYDLGDEVSGGMGGGMIMDGLWIHPKILENNEMQELVDEVKRQLIEE